MRQPLEDEEVIISRARQTVVLPASFMLVGAANPCPCGWLGHASGRCECRPEEIVRYSSRISGALVDRIDMVVEAPALTTDELLSEGEGESSDIVRDRVARARAIATDRSGRPNSKLRGRLLRQHAKIDSVARDRLRASIDKFQLSARSLERLLRVARTIADLAGEPAVGVTAIAAALRYRRLVVVERAET